MKSAFGVIHQFSKADALGSTESILGMEHDRGEHSGKSFRRCPGCNKGAFGSVQKRPAAVKALKSTYKLAR